MSEIKRQFPIYDNDPGLVYLDSASSTQKPRVVIEAERSFYESSYANVHRGLYRLSENATMLYESARKKTANFINAENDEIIFTKGTTEGLNFIASKITEGLGEGDAVLLTEMEHHANLVPWQMAAKKHGFSLRFIPITKEGKLDLTDIHSLLENVRVVSLTHASNVLGTVNDISPIASAAHKAGAIVIVDAAQSIAHLSIDVKELGVDFLVFSGHKMYGPTGIGVLFGRKNLLGSIEPYQFGGDMVKSVSFESSSWADIPGRFEAGTPNIAGAVGLAAAIDWLKEQSAPDHRLTKELMSEIGLGASIYGPNERIGVISFNIPGVHAHDVAAFLAEHNVAVRAGHHCAMPLHSKLGIEASARVSLGINNDEEDVENFISVLKQCSRVLRVSK